MSQQAVIADIQRTMHSEFPEAVTYLYGSRARGEARADSDYDLLILLPDSLARDALISRRFQIRDRMTDLELLHLADISTMVYKESDWTAHVTPFRINVNHDRILL